MVRAEGEGEGGGGEEGRMRAEGRKAAGRAALIRTNTGSLPHFPEPHKLKQRDTSLDGLLCRVRASRLVGQGHGGVGWRGRVGADWAGWGRVVAGWGRAGQGGEGWARVVVG